jgi:hypothetical protein
MRVAKATKAKAAKAERSEDRRAVLDVVRAARRRARRGQEALGVVSKRVARNTELKRRRPSSA